MKDSEQRGIVLDALYNLLLAKQYFAQATDTGTLEELKAASVQYTAAASSLLRAVLDYTSAIHYEE